MGFLESQLKKKWQVPYINLCDYWKKIFYRKVKNERVKPQREEP